MRQALEQAGASLIPLLVPIVGGLLSALIAYAITYIKNKTKNSTVLSALDRLDQVAEDAVKDAQQRIVSSIKPNDNLATTLAEAKTSAVDAVKSHYGAKGLEELKKVLGWDDLEKNLSTKIEAKVHDLKMARDTVQAMSPETKPAA